MFITKLCRGLDSNRGLLESEVTALPNDHNQNRLQHISLGNGKIKFKIRRNIWKGRLGFTKNLTRTPTLVLYVTNCYNTLSSSRPIDGGQDACLLLRRSNFESCCHQNDLWFYEKKKLTEKEAEVGSSLSPDCGSQTKWIF